MKVLIITSAKSGPLKTANAIARYLAERKDHVYVYLLDVPEYDLDFKNVILDRPSSLLEPLGYYGRLIRLGMLGKVKFLPDVILTSFALLIPFVKIFFPSVPIIYRMMGLPRLQFSEGVLKFTYALETSMAKKYVKESPTVTTGEHYRRLISREWKIDVYCIHNGVDTEFYKPVENKDKVKNELELGKYDYFVTLGLTRFNEVFKPITYIKWYLDALCQHKEKRILTLILGKTNAKQRQKLQEMIDGHLVKERASNHSFRIDYIKDNYLLRKCYQISDIFISFMPQSLMEKEALACGVPAITEFWEGENALKQLAILQHKLVREEFIKIVSTLLEDAKLREALSRKARFVAERDFSYSAMGRKYRKILEMVKLKTCNASSLK